MPARQHRITRGDDYRRTVRSGRRVGGAYCITHAVFCAPETPARFGFIVTKAVGNAVTRNLVRRRLKTIVERQINDGLTGVDIVFRAFPQIAEASFEDLEREVARAIARAKRDNLDPAKQRSKDRGANKAPDHGPRGSKASSEAPGANAAPETLQQSVS